MMTSVILLGMVRRERTGFVGIGFESTLVLVLYVASVVLLFI
jgi:cation:H+ antiporter